MKTQKFILYCFLATGASIGAAPANSAPNFDEVYTLVRSNLTGVNPAELNHAAVQGLLDQFPGQVMIEGDSVNTNSASAPRETLAKVALYDGAYVYFRIAKIEGRLNEKLRAAYQDLASTNKSKIKGVVLDLRFAGGTDYAAASGVADCFLDSSQQLLDWGSGTANATKKTNAISAPVAILVNAETTGAAEALAAELREADTGLILGSTTAGKASIFKEIPLSDGQKLLVANAPVKLGNGTPLAHGLQPDIAVEEPLPDARAYLNDPYKILHADTNLTGVAPSNSKKTTARSEHRRTNEAELVRQRKEGVTDDENADDVPDESVPAVAVPPVIADAALARALDLLKGLAVLQQSHPG